MTLAQVQIECDLTLQKLEKLFKRGCMLTLVMRNPYSNDGDLLFTKDDPDKVIEAIQRLADRDKSLRDG